MSSDYRAIDNIIAFLKARGIFLDHDAGDGRESNPTKPYYETLIEPVSTYSDEHGDYSYRSSNPRKATGMAESERARIPLNDFVFPETRSWPIHDERHAILAIQYMERGFGRESDYPKIERAVASRYGHNPKVAKALQYYRKHFK